MKIKTKPITVFGAANADITGFVKDTLIYKDANIGRMHISAGGVGRNIAQNLQHLGFQVQFTGVFGDDPLSRFLIDDCRDKHLDISKSLFLENQPAATFLAIMDEHNDLAVGISAMTLYDDLHTDLFISNLPESLKSEYIVLETNFSADILKQIVQKYQAAKFVLDTVSGKKALRALPVLKHLYILKTNLLEAQMMSGLQGQSPKDLEKLVRFFIGQGVKKVFITLGKDGVIYGDAKSILHKKAIPSRVVNTIGAGDAFVSGLVYADYHQKTLSEMADYGMAAAAITVQSTAAVSNELTIDHLQKLLNHA